MNDAIKYENKLMQKIRKLAKAEKENDFLKSSGIFSKKINSSKNIKEILEPMAVKTMEIFLNHTTII